MHPFVEFLSIFGALALVLVATIIVLTLFFRALERIAKGGSPEKFSVAGVVQPDTWATVHMDGGKTFERVRIVGQVQAQKNGLPYDLHGMLVLEDEHRTRYVIRSRHVRMIVVASGGESSGA